MTDINLQVLELIKQNKSLKEISSTLDLTEKQLFIRIKQLINYGYNMDSTYYYDADISYNIIKGISQKTDKPIIFNFHGYPHLIHQLVYNRTNEDLHVHGYQEEGTITTPFDMRVQNKIDRFNLVIDALKYLPQLGNRSARLIQWCKNKLVEHKHHIAEYGEDLEEVRNWKWQ